MMHQTISKILACEEKVITTVIKIKPVPVPKSTKRGLEIDAALGRGWPALVSYYPSRQLANRAATKLLHPCLSLASF